MGIILPADDRGILLPGGPQAFNPRHFAVPDGLVAYWGLDPDCMTSVAALDISSAKGGGSATLQGTSLPNIADGQIGGALNFVAASNQYAQTSAPVSALNAVSAFTMTMWAKKSATGKYAVIGQTSASTTQPNQVLQYWNDGNVYFDISANPSAGTLGQYTFQDANWHHFVGVFDGTQSGNAARLKVYQDGVLKTLSFTGTIPATTPTATQGFSIGNLNYGGANNSYSNGLIDDVRIYNRALDPSEVQQLYYVGLQGRRDAGPWLPMEAELPAINTSGGFLAAWAMGRNQISQGWAS